MSCELCWKKFAKITVLYVYTHEVGFDYIDFPISIPVHHISSGRYGTEWVKIEFVCKQLPNHVMDAEPRAQS